MKGFILKFSLLSATLTWTLMGFGQSLERSVVSSSGQITSNGGISISATSGESVVTTQQNSTLIITQGFQQNTKKDKEDPGETGLAEITWAQLSLFPNPSQDRVQIEGLPQSKVQVKVYDASGKAIYITESDQQSSFEFSVSTWATGTYHLWLYDPLSDQQTSFKVVKQ